MRASRTRLAYFACALGVVVLGLASRRFGQSLHHFIAAYAGDTLWALLVFLITGFLAPRLRVAQRVCVALGFAWTVELSQLYHAPWIDAIRRTRFGGLMLGFGFLWSDLLCYSVGIGLGALGERAMRRRRCPDSPPSSRRGSS